MTRRFIDGGIDVSAYAPHIGTALHVALKAMHCASALMLIDAGSDLSATLNHGAMYDSMAPLHLAVSKGNDGGCRAPSATRRA